MILQHDAQDSEDSLVAETIEANQKLHSDDESSPDIDTPSFLKGIHECERLLEAVWPAIVPPAHAVPTRFGKFSIVRELGRGGFGIVFLAFDSSLRRHVALKVPRPEVMVRPDFRTRFLREAEAASRLEHRHIVTVYEVGEEGPICYIASAYCDGPTLAAWLRDLTAQVPVLVAARLVATLSAAVAHAHERSILHRDLKPGNILLQGPVPSSFTKEQTRDVLLFEPRICDFGLAKLLDQVSQETCTGVPIGSASYMAPEQAAGRLREQGKATDVYALGVILYELLTGRTPFRGDTDLETIHLVSDQDPPPPRTLRLGLPRDLETITLKCLEKQPNRRYETATELTADLERFLEGKPVRARPVSALESAGKWVKRRPVHATLALVVTLAAAGIVGIVVWSGAWLRWHQEDKRDAVFLAERDTKRHERSAQETRIEAIRTSERDHSARLRYALNSQVRLIHETLESGSAGVAATMLAAHDPAPGRPVPDGFAWCHVRSLFRPEISRLPRAGLDGLAVLKLAISPDGRTLASGISDGRVILWDLKTERLCHTLLHGVGPGHEVYYLAFSPDGRYLATASPVNLVKIWDLATFTERATLPLERKGVRAHLDGVIQLRFADDANVLAVFAQGWHDGKFQVWFWSVPALGGKPELKEILDQKQLPSFGSQGRLKDPTWPRAQELTSPWLAYARRRLVLLDDGVTFAIKDGATDATLFDSYHHTPAARIRAPLNIPVIRQRPFIGFGPGDTQQLSRQAHRIAESVDKRNRLSTRPFDVAEFAPGGRTVAVHLEGDSVRGVGVALIDVASNRTLITNVPGRWRVIDLAFTPDGRTLVMGGTDSQIHLWHVRPNALAGHKKEIWSLAFSPDGKSLASGADDHTVKLWDVADGREHTTVNGHGSLVTAVAYSPDGALMASASFDKTIRLYSAATGEHMGTLGGHTDRVRALAFSPDGKILASAGNDRAIRLWVVESGSELTAPLTGHAGSVFALAFALDGKTLYSGALDKNIMLWDWRQGQVRQTWRTEDEVYSLAVTPDGQTLAAAYHLGKVALWDVAHETVHATLKGHAGDVLGLAFSPDGQTLASAGRDQMVRLWDPVTSQELLTLKGHQAPVHAVAFSQDGTILASGSHDGAIKLWRAPNIADYRDSSRPVIASMPAKP
jgi:eukaryotic-like serine/threonine-protein kinase